MKIEINGYNEPHRAADRSSKTVDCWRWEVKLYKGSRSIILKQFHQYNSWWETVGDYQMTKNGAIEYANALAIVLDTEWELNEYERQVVTKEDWVKVN